MDFSPCQDSLRYLGNQIINDNMTTVSSGSFNRYDLTAHSGDIKKTFLSSYEYISINVVNKKLSTPKPVIDLSDSFHMIRHVEGVLKEAQNKFKTNNLERSEELLTGIEIDIHHLVFSKKEDLQYKTYLQSKIHFTKACIAHIKKDKARFEILKENLLRIKDMNPQSCKKCDEYAPEMTFVPLAEIAYLDIFIAQLLCYEGNYTEAKSLLRLSKRCLWLYHARDRAINKNLEQMRDIVDRLLGEIKDVDEGLPYSNNAVNLLISQEFYYF